MRNLLLILPVVLMMAVPHDVLAATQSEALVNQGTGIGGLFDQNLATIGVGFLQVARSVAVGMTVVALAMIMLGLESGNKVLWNWLLGIGLATNFGAFVIDVFSVPSPTSMAAVTPFVPDLNSSNDGKISVLGDFMTTYMQVINRGAAVITPICIRLLLILMTLQCSYEIAFKLYSGDKIKYLMAAMVKAGFMIFVIENWVEGIGLMPALSQGFETLGLMMGGASSAASPDNIVGNAIEIFSAFWDNAHFNSIGLALVNIVALLTMIFVLFMAAIEMTMARIEFYTMALLVMPLLPFIVTSKFSFLSDKAIGAMFNLAIKVMAIAFIGTVASPFLSGFAKKVASTSDAWEQIGIIFQVVLTALITYVVVKKISNLVSGLLNGQPSLGGSDMTGAMGKAVGGTVGGAAKMAGHVAGATDMTANKLRVDQLLCGGKYGDIKLGEWLALGKGTVSELGKAGYRSNPISRAYRSGMQNIRELNQDGSNEKKTEVKDKVAELQKESPKKQ